MPRVPLESDGFAVEMIDRQILAVRTFEITQLEFPLDGHRADRVLGRLAGLHIDDDAVV